MRRKGSAATQTKAVALPFVPRSTALGLPFEIKAIDAAQRIIEGYASTKHLDLMGDEVRGKAHLGRVGGSDPNDVEVFIGHDWKSGALPVGIPLEIKQDPNGLFTRTKIHNTARGDELLTVAAERLAAGKSFGISIGYPTDGSLKVHYETKDGRTIRVFDEYVLREYSFTPIPVNEHAAVTAVKDLPAGMTVCCPACAMYGCCGSGCNCTAAACECCTGGCSCCGNGCTCCSTGCCDGSCGKCAANCGCCVKAARPDAAAGGGEGEGEGEGEGAQEPAEMADMKHQDLKVAKGRLDLELAVAQTK